MVPAADGLPTGTHDGEVVLPTKELLRLASEAVTEVRVMDVAVMEPKTFPAEADRPIGRP